MGKLMGGLLLVAAMPAMADTAASIWQEDEDRQLDLDDSALDAMPKRFASVWLLGDPRCETPDQILLD